MSPRKRNGTLARQRSARDPSGALTRLCPKVPVGMARQALEGRRKVAVGPNRPGLRRYTMSAVHAKAQTARWRQTVWILISMSTPAGRSRRWSASTVFGVCSTMSTSLLWTRISKCSRLSLYL